MMAVTMVVMLIVKEMGRAEGCELLLMDGTFPDSRMLLHTCTVRVPCISFGYPIHIYIYVVYIYHIYLYPIYILLSIIY